LVFNRLDPDPRSLRLAYEWARWVCRRQSRDNDAGAIDTDEVLAALDRARRALKRHQTIRTCHSLIKAKSDEAGTHVAALVGEVDQAIDELAALVREAPRKIA